MGNVNGHVESNVGETRSLSMCVVNSLMLVIVHHTIQLQCAERFMDIAFTMLGHVDFPAILELTFIVIARIVKIYCIYMATSTQRELEVYALCAIVEGP